MVEIFVRRELVLYKGFQAIADVGFQISEIKKNIEGCHSEIRYPK